MTCIWIMPTVSIKTMRGPYKHIEGCLAFLKVVRNAGLGRIWGVLDILSPMLNNAKHDSVSYCKKWWVGRVKYKQHHEQNVLCSGQLHAWICTSVSSGILEGTSKLKEEFTRTCWFGFSKQC